jgi:hypothetical protein
MATIAGGCRNGSSGAVPADAARDSLATSADASSGCHDNAGCGPDEYCAFQPGLCGKGKRPGTCRPRPTTCADVPYSPVCGCDQKIYDDECAARAAGVDLAVMGGCGTRLANWIPCGKRLCDVRKDYCAIYLSDVFELPTDYFCRPLPPSCLPGDGAARTCACFPPDTPCLAFCGPMPTTGLSGFHLTCQGKKPPRE